ncbi:hypothetical protein SELMODRAFT_81344 [Selaginella moellendorffii]|uniref:Pre-mRNA processing factor 4 (PRP4)-like domain-containing protein n=1 Tax=Selaginella moellendorffii TaxID=88036 RepID=D8QZK5_SELML|nr:U4/U6 small nuclear ribonucleoprotein PRP4-like protein [Selaginella moellendorffii]EFJ34421.1 hypothetical protein SELMODRAFT_81344 [Selaginella moellendorffii]|eukprot:XP_002964088.1 U4/U6 small nuclear ribonucleoprotein PRP4-like protein [Selaginella moellendorffii]
MAAEVAKTVALADIPTLHSDGAAAVAKKDEYEVSEASKVAREKHEKDMERILLQRRAAALAVPTSDAAVKEKLRQMGQPVTLFGEREMERRDRLRYLMADEGGDRLPQKQEAKEESVKISAVQKSTFYTEGTADLLRARMEILHFSVPRAADRIARAKRKRENPDEDEEQEIKSVLKSVANFSLDCSEIGDDRPLTGCAFSPDSALLATCGWTGVAKIWSVPDVKKVGALKGHHTERLTDVVFSPDGQNIATASADRTAMVWDLQGNMKMAFKGHLTRLARIAFHPSGAYIGTTSFDKTWRLWDVNTGAEVLLQEGHSRGLYGIAFQCDGSLVASCGMDALTRVWDLRTGRSIMALEGHVKPVLGVDFSKNGYHLATGGEDHTCKIWDLRRKAMLYTIPAHSSLISQVKYEREDGYYLMTASFDNTAKAWSGRDFKPVKTLSGHEGKLTGVDVTSDNQYVVTVAHDRTIKLWSQKNSPADDKEDEEMPDVGEGEQQQHETQELAEMESEKEEQEDDEGEMEPPVQ